MAVESIWCLVRATVVERLLDDDGRVISVICPEFCGNTASCRLQGGALDDRALSQLVERVPSHPLQHPAGRCAII